MITFLLSFLLFASCGLAPAESADVADFAAKAVLKKLYDHGELGREANESLAALVKSDGFQGLKNEFDKCFSLEESAPSGDGSGSYEYKVNGKWVSRDAYIRVMNCRGAIDSLDKTFSQGGFISTNVRSYLHTLDKELSPHNGLKHITLYDDSLLNIDASTPFHLAFPVYSSNLQGFFDACNDRIGNLIILLGHIQRDEEFSKKLLTNVSETASYDAQARIEAARAEGVHAQHENSRFMVEHADELQKIRENEARGIADKATALQDLSASLEKENRALNDQGRQVHEGKMAEIADSNAKKAASEATKASHDATKAGHYAAMFARAYV